ncbi:MAG: transposase [Synechococcaceae cyanobacterium]|nr:transposase [Synechococcaceae cyanobacterium]
MNGMLASTAEIATALGLSDRAIRKRIAIQKWPHTGEKKQGGGYLFDVNALPLKPEERKKVALHFKEQKVVAAAAEITEQVAATGQVLPENSSKAVAAQLGAQISSEAKAAAEATKANQAAAAAKFEALPEKRKTEALAKRELLLARDAFMAKAHIKNIKIASEKFSVLYVAGQIALPEWVCEYAQRSGRLSMSWSQLNRWRKQYETAGLLGLVNGFKGHVGSSLPKDVQEAIEGMITAHPHVKDKRLLDFCAARFHGQDISDSAIRRYAKKFRTDNEGLLLYLANPDAWKNQQMLALGNASERIVALNQLWEMDSTPTDLMLIDGRHTIVGCLDVMPRRPKLLVSPTSKATAVSALIRRCLIDWGCPPATRGEGNPFEGIKTDNGSDYTAVHIDVVLEALQINQPLCPPFSPEKKPHIERFFHTMSHGLMELMPGFVGHNVAERKAIEARKSFAQRLMKHGEEPIKVELTSSQLQTLLDRWVNAIYMQDVHAELGMSPAEAVRRWTEPIRRIENERALDMLLMPGACKRTLGKKGIRHGGGEYIAAEFGYLDVGTELRVLPDATDLGTIYCYRVAGEFVCVAQDPERTGIDRAEIAARAKAIQKQVMQDGAGELRAKAKKSGAAQAFEEILQHRESLIANVAELPKRAESFSTPALEQAAVAAVARQEQVVKPEERRAARAAATAELEAEGKLVKLPVDRVGRIRHCRNLERRIAAGETIGDIDRDWLVNYMRSSEYRDISEVRADLAQAHQ